MSNDDPAPSDRPATDDSPSGAQRAPSSDGAAPRDGFRFEDRPGDIRTLFEQAMDQTRMAMALSDPSLPDSPLVYVNQSFLDLTGYARGDVLGRNCRFLQGSDTDPATVKRIGRAVRDEAVTIEEILNYRADGTPFWNALHVGPIYGPDGQLRYHFASQWDVSDARRTREAERDARLLAEELTLRLRQLFPIISDVVKMTARHEGEPRFARQVNERIAALARAYDATLINGARRQTSLLPVVRAVLDPYTSLGADEHRRGPGAIERVRISGEAVAMAPEVVSLLGLVLHELATRATRSGALSVPDGTLELSWAFDANRAFVMEWRENGRGRTRQEADTPPMLVDLVASAGGQLVSRPRPQGYQTRLSLPQQAWARASTVHATPD